MRSFGVDLSVNCQSQGGVPNPTPQTKKQNKSPCNLRAHMEKFTQKRPISMDKTKDRENRGPKKTAKTEKGAKVSPELQAAPVKKRRQIKKKKKTLNKRNKYLHLVLAKAPINNRVADVQHSAEKPEKKKIDETNDRKKRKLKLNPDEERLVFAKKVKTDISNAKTKKKRKTDMNDPREIKRRSSSLKDKVMQRLAGSQFRFLNEQLYKTTSDEAFKFFTEDPSQYHVYHNGYQIQMSKWPVKPLDIIVEEIKSSSKSLVIADFGCGDASLATRVANTVHSFDLVALNDRVTECDMSHVPLEDRSVDVAVFCLSLMGTNFVDYLVEANRVLKYSGSLKIAEIKARFKSTDIFIKIIQRLGFKLLNKDEENTMFVYFNLMKCNGITKGGIPKLKLKPCVYKKR